MLEILYRKKQNPKMSITTVAELGLDVVKDLNQKNTLLIAIGNSARSDDGLGWAFLDHLRQSKRFLGKSVYCYQLQVEDAEMISHYPRVIFVDAWTNDSEHCFAWEKTEAQNDFTFTTHALTPESVLFLCQDLYQQSPQAYTLKIRGKEWELEEGLSDRARSNLQEAIEFFDNLLTKS